MFLESSYTMGLIVMLYDQREETGRGNIQVDSC